MNRRSLVHVAVFGSLWGFSEATLGTVLHMLNLPFSGLILSAIGLIIILVARTYNNVPGSTVMMALIAAFVKVISFSTVKLGPFTGIIMEGILTEVIFLTIGIGRTGFITAGITVAIYPVLQNILVKTILFGIAFVPVILELVDGISENVGYGAGWWLLGIYLGIHLVVGVGAAMLALLLLRRARSITEQNA
ncbi:MAG: hypothetical protein KAU50_09365 [Candidatus Marinimicrobia bacterium]|nr:hypothetical protein [Candidatus Neomarinimicrobiota bacterium]